MSQFFLFLKINNKVDVNNFGLITKIIKFITILFNV